MKEERNNVRSILRFSDFRSAAILTAWRAGIRSRYDVFG